MRMQWLYRHPKTRLVAGFGLQLITLIGLISMLTLNLGLFAASISMACLFLFTFISRVKDIRARNNEDASTQRNKTFFESDVGAKIKAFITKLSQKIGMKTPLIEHDKIEFAMAQAWPYTQKILINDGIVREPQDIQQSVLAHELAHIYNQDQIKLELSCFLQILHIYAFVAFATLSLAITAFQLYQGYFTQNILVGFMSSAIPLSLGILLCACISQLAAGIVVRAAETQADLKGCELLEDPTIAYRAFALQSDDKKPKYDTYKSYFNSWLTQHPSDWQRKEDIAIQFPTQIEKLRLG